MKKIVAITLLAVLAYNVIGFVVIFKTLQNRMKNDFLFSLSKDLSNHDLTIICYSPETKAGFSMLEEHELCYNGDMYDIVKEELKGGKRFFYCISDKAETILIANMEVSIAKNLNSHDRNGTAQMFMLMLGFYVMPDSKSQIFLPEIKNHFTGNFFRFQKSPYIGLHFPPPKVS